MAGKPIHCYYWRDAKGRCKSNFGDALSPLLISEILNRQVVWSAPYRADIMGIGSIIGHAKKVWRRLIVSRQTCPLYVWGSGSLLPIRPRTRFMEFLAVRGAKTRDFIGLIDTMPLGDPGLLSPLLLEGRVANTKPKFRLGVIPHWREKSAPAVLEFVERFPHCKIIDVTNPDVLEVTRTIASCEFVLSSSLHGLVVADSFGIPNARFRLSTTKHTNDWKFEDYFSGVKRNCGPVVDRLLTIQKMSDLTDFLDCAESAVVSSVSQKLLQVLRDWA